MRITVQATGETLEVATGKHGNKDDQRRGNDLICRVVRPRFTPAARRRANDFRRGRATSQGATYAALYGEQAAHA